MSIRLGIDIETAGEAATALTRRAARDRSGQIHGRRWALSCPPVGSSYWPLLGTFMSASGQFFMSADIRAPPASEQRRRSCECRTAIRAASPADHQGGRPRHNRLSDRPCRAVRVTRTTGVAGYALPRPTGAPTHGAAPGLGVLIDATAAANDAPPWRRGLSEHTKGCCSANETGSHHPGNEQIRAASPISQFPFPQEGDTAIRRI